MDYKKEFPHIFEKRLCIKLNRIKLNDVEQNKSARITRSSKKTVKDISWVRIKSGTYKDDIARVSLFDEKNGQVHVKLFPRIHYGPKATKRRPPQKAFDPEAIR